MTWAGLLLAAICFEGLGRKFLPIVPAAVYYFLKDVILIVGLFLFKIRPSVVKAARWSFGLFAIVVVLGMLWTLMEIFNPEQTSLLLALVGFRAYWLWWLAPLVVASAIRTPRQMEQTVIILALIGIVVAVMAFVQFARPVDDPINMYAPQPGEAKNFATAVATTQRTRVSSTFSYITGFTSFVTLAPGTLLALGLGQGRPWVRWITFLSVILLAIATPMSGSRLPVVLSAMLIGLVVLSAGVVRNRTGQRAVIALMVAVPLVLYAAPSAVKGVSDRFEQSDTIKRLVAYVDLLPPVAMTTYRYPTMGIGTGMMQNARLSMGISSKWATESPEARYLVELGPVGYLLYWFLRLGLLIALVRIGIQLRRFGRRGIAACAFGLAGLGPFGAWAFDHIWQALYFFTCGLILSAFVQAVEDAKAHPAGAAKVSR